MRRKVVRSGAYLFPTNAAVVEDQPAQRCKDMLWTVRGHGRECHAVPAQVQAVQ